MVGLVMRSGLRNGAHFLLFLIFVKLNNMRYYGPIGYLLCFYILFTEPYQTMQFYRIIYLPGFDYKGNITDFPYIF